MNLPQYKCHLFVCTNTKEKGSSCGPRGGAELRMNLKKSMDEKFPDQKSHFRINGAGCLGQCEKGIAAVMYPSGEWKTHLTPDHLSELEAWVTESLQKETSS